QDRSCGRLDDGEGRGAEGPPADAERPLGDRLQAPRHRLQRHLVPRRHRPPNADAPLRRRDRRIGVKERATGWSKASGFCPHTTRRGRQVPDEAKTYIWIPCADKGWEAKIYQIIEVHKFRLLRRDDGRPNLGATYNYYGNWSDIRGGDSIIVVGH